MVVSKSVASSTHSPIYYKASSAQHSRKQENNHQPATRRRQIRQLSGLINGAMKSFPVETWVKPTNAHEHTITAHTPLSQDNNGTATCCDSSLFPTFTMAETSIEPPMPPIMPIPAPAGKALVPQRQLQEHSPPFMDPVPITMPLPLLLLETAEVMAGGGGAAATEAGGGGGGATAAAEAGGGGGAATDAGGGGGAAADAGGGGGGAAAAAAPVPFCCMAMDWKAAKDLVAVGLMAKTMPSPQWAVWRQYIPREGGLSVGRVWRGVRY